MDMKRMKLWVALILALALMLPVVAMADKLADVKAAGKLLVGTSINFPPFEFWYDDPVTKEQKLEGFEMKLAEGLAAELGVEFVPVDQAFSGLITELRAGSIDVIISGMVMKPDRVELVDFSTPFFFGKQVMLVHKDKADTYKTVESINGQKLGVQMGALQVELAAEQFPDSEAMQLDSIPTLIMELAMGNVEGVILADSVAASYAKVNPNIVISEIPVAYSTAGVGIAVAKSEDNASFLEAINAYLEKVLADGTFEKWVDEAYEINGLLLQESK
jgi:ABC-type amino acid transport substrate-binding protein